MDLEVIHTNSKNTDFIKLIHQLDEDLNCRYGELQKQYAAHNNVVFIKDVVIIYNDGIPVGCGAFKEYSSDTIELKRIFVSIDYRRRGLSTLLVNELEHTAKQKGYKYVLLETGVKQLEAISLYKKLGYIIIENYGPYLGNSNSLCMEKSL